MCGETDLSKNEIESSIDFYAPGYVCQRKKKKRNKNLLEINKLLYRYTYITGWNKKTQKIKTKFIY